VIGGTALGTSPSMGLSVGSVMFAVVVLRVRCCLFIEVPRLSIG
jgi:hypothetical protein